MSQACVLSIVVRVPLELVGVSIATQSPGIDLMTTSIVLLTDLTRRGGSLLDGRG